MSIFKLGSSLEMTLNIDEIANKSFGIQKPECVLIVEGITDKIALEKVECINNFSLKFVIRTPEEVSKDCVDGKGEVIEFMKNNPDDESKYRALIDRDYDFFLNIDHSRTDPRIFYYDYYELENYAFDKDLCKNIIISKMPEFEKEAFQELLLKFEEFENEFGLINLYQMSLFRELDFLGKGITELENKRAFGKIMKDINLSGIILGKVPGANGNDGNERIQNYLKNEVNKIREGLYDEIIIELKGKKIAQPDNFLEFCQFYYKGKKLLGCFDVLLQTYIDASLPNFKDIKSLLHGAFLAKSEIFLKKILELENSF